MRECVRRASVQSDISNWNTGDVAQWLERLNSIQRTWFSIPWRGRIREENMSLRVNSCAELFAPDSPSCVRHAPEFVRTLSRAICRKTAGLTAGGKVSQNTVYTRLEINYGWGQQTTQQQKPTYRSALSKVIVKLSQPLIWVSLRSWARPHQLCISPCRDQFNSIQFNSKNVLSIKHDIKWICVLSAYWARHRQLYFTSFVSRFPWYLGQDTVSYILPVL